MKIISIMLAFLFGFATGWAAVRYILESPDENCDRYSHVMTTTDIFGREHRQHDCYGCERSLFYADSLLQEFANIGLTLDSLRILKGEIR